MYEELVTQLRADEIPLDELIRTMREAAEGGCMICLMQLLYYEATQYMKKPKILKCCDCPFREKCTDEAKEET